jgi:hypothetical protein
MMLQQRCSVGTSLRAKLLLATQLRGWSPLHQGAVRHA